ncbi:Phophatidylserine decarboxylase-domain-containing protein [Xylaria cf. heliscus]|nr:Phophatidylserine decarboxylase-domain-containing protein [Xylaria cf. heliscus]
MVHQHGDGVDIPEEHKMGHLGSWLPSDHRVQHDWMAKRVAHVDSQPEQPLIPVLQEFKELIEGNSRIYMYFDQMWDEVPMKKPYFNDPTGKRQIRDYRHMLAVLNHVFTQAPQWNESAFGVGMVGVPMVSVFDYVMATPSGHAAFLDPDVNKMVKKVLDEWGRFLKASLSLTPFMLLPNLKLYPLTTHQSPKSAEVLTTANTGWFSTHGKSDLMEVANAPLKTGHSFEDMYVCDPSAKYHGYTSWDDFFTRQLRPNVRPVASPKDPSVIANACESTPYHLSRASSLRAKFWIKSQPYSVLDMLAYDPLSAQFANSTVYQAFLSALSYHRWHSPVSGRVVRAFVAPGTYFSEPLFPAAADSGRAADDPRVVYAINVQGLRVSQAYLAALAARAVIFLQADNPAIGLMAFVGVGMDEVSTCEITVQQGQRVEKGDQLGMFHFGGSSHCLLFREEVKLEGFPQIGLDHNVPVRSQLAVVKS